MSQNNTRRDFLKSMSLTVSAMALPNSVSVAQRVLDKKGKGKPNIILVLTDDQGWTDTSVQMMADRSDSKSDFYQTPNLERMAKEGMIFSNAYSPGPVCSPTRYSIQCGKSPARLHHATLDSEAASPWDEVSIPRMIKAAAPNYVASHFGKWHIPKQTPEEMGYDRSDGPTGNYEGDWLDDKRPLPADDPKRTFSLSRRACNFMEEQVRAGRPFYMQVSYYAVHVQHYALKKTKEKYHKMKPGKKCEPSDFMIPQPPLNVGIVDYAAMIEDLDAGFGMLLNKLDELGIADKTYVIYISDNGGGFRGNTPLAKGKADLWEGGIRVPMVVRGPGVLAGSYCDVPIVGWDFFPTFSDLIGNPNPLPKNLDGGSLRSVFENGNEGRVRRGEDALIFHFPWYNGEPESAIRLGNYKLIKNLDSRKLWLFNLAEDIEEDKNLLYSIPKKAEELHKKLRDYLKAVDAEHVQTLRKNWRQRIIDEIVPQQEKKIKQLRAKLESENKSVSDELAETERYLKWLKDQIIFIDERSRLHSE